MSANAKIDGRDAVGVDLASFGALRSAAGTALLAELAAGGPIDDDVALRLGTRLRRDHPGDLVAAALTQARLRERAAAKFGSAAATMWFTPTGLEQATDPAVAAHRAARIAAALGPDAAVLDLCCGVGSDLLALAAAGLGAAGIDADPLTAAVADANLRGRAGVAVGDAQSQPLDGSAAVFVDPARRTSRGRVFDPRAYSPPWSFVCALLDGSAGVPAAAAKVAPGIPHDLVPPGVQAEWVSLRGGVKEAALYAGALATGGPARRRATLLPGGHTLTAAGPDTEETPPPVGAPGRWLYEPDGAVIRAHLVGAVAEAVDGRLLDPTIAYVTADTLVPTPFATAYEVTDVLPFAVAPLRALLRARGVGVLTVKKRGSPIVPEQLRRDLLRGARGDAQAIVVITRRAGTPTALVVRPA